MNVLETDRLLLRKLSADDDAAFILQLVNEPSWLRFIGDRGVRTLEDARGYILKGPMEMYRRFGFGLYLVVNKADGVPMGLCGLLKRDSLPDVDIGFAFLPRFWGQGYAHEAAAAVLAQGQNTFGLRRILAITSPDNHSSIKLLEKLGLRFQQLTRLSSDADEVKLFALDV
jgi:RimJ/RimL family protein N-acetyltransferase